jgi:hypothetical protein
MNNRLWRQARQIVLMLKSLAAPHGKSTVHPFQSFSGVTDALMSSGKDSPMLVTGRVPNHYVRRLNKGNVPLV